MAPKAVTKKSMLSNKKTVSKPKAAPKKSPKKSEKLKIEMTVPIEHKEYPADFFAGGENASSAPKNLAQTETKTCKASEVLKALHDHISKATHPQTLDIRLGSFVVTEIWNKLKGQLSFTAHASVEDETLLGYYNTVPVRISLSTPQNCIHVFDMLAKERNFREELIIDVEDWKYAVRTSSNDPEIPDDLKAFHEARPLPHDGEPIDCDGGDSLEHLPGREANTINRPPEVEVATDEVLNSIAVRIEQAPVKETLQCWMDPVSAAALRGIYQNDRRFEEDIKFIDTEAGTAQVGRFCGVPLIVSQTIIRRATVELRDTALNIKTGVTRFNLISVAKTGGRDPKKSSEDFLKSIAGLKLMPALASDMQQVAKFAGALNAKAVEEVDKINRMDARLAQGKGKLLEDMSPKEAVVAFAAGTHLLSITRYEKFHAPIFRRLEGKYADLIAALKGKYTELDEVDFALLISAVETFFDYPNLQEAINEQAADWVERLQGKLKDLLILVGIPSDPDLKNDKYMADLASAVAKHLRDWYKVVSIGTVYAKKLEAPVGVEKPIPNRTDEELLTNFSPENQDEEVEAELNRRSKGRPFLVYESRATSFLDVKLSLEMLKEARKVQTPTVIPRDNKLVGVYTISQVTLKHRMRDLCPLDGKSILFRNFCPHCRKDFGYIQKEDRVILAVAAKYYKDTDKLHETYMKGLLPAVYAEYPELVQEVATLKMTGKLPTLIAIDDPVPSTPPSKSPDPFHGTTFKAGV